MGSMKNYIEALKNLKGYDWISNHGHELSKDELINIVKELDYAIYHNTTHSERKDICNSAADELEDWYLE